MAVEPPKGKNIGQKSEIIPKKEVKMNNMFESPNYNRKHDSWRLHFATVGPTRTEQNHPGKLIALVDWFVHRDFLQFVGVESRTIWESNLVQSISIHFNRTSTTFRLNTQLSTKILLLDWPPAIECSHCLLQVVFDLAIAGTFHFVTGAGAGAASLAASLTASSKLST